MTDRTCTTCTHHRRWGWLLPWRPRCRLRDEGGRRAWAVATWQWRQRLPGHDYPCPERRER
jgi:hypothetical protein